MTIKTIKHHPGLLTDGKLIGSMRQIYRYINVIVLVCVYLFTFIPSVYAEDITNTVFLPLKINTLKNRNDLTAIADTSLKELGIEKNLVVPDRKQTSQVLDYESWPPALKETRPLLTSDAIAIASRLFPLLKTLTRECSE